MTILIRQRECADSTAVLSFACKKTAFLATRVSPGCYCGMICGGDLKYFRKIPFEMF